MTTLVNFQPPANAPFQFQPTLDGQVYTCSVTWLLFGRRYYVQCYDLSGTLIFMRPLIGSPDTVNIETISWDANQATLVTDTPHGFRVGQTAQVTISGCTPDAYNGDYQVLVTDTETLTYSLPGTNPGQASVTGVVAQNFNIAGGYFASKLVYRESSAQFEISP